MKDSWLKKVIDDSQSKTIAFCQWPVQKGMVALLYLGDKKRAFPEAFRKGLAYLIFPVVAGIVAYFGLKDVAVPQWWPDYFESHHITYAATRSFITSTITAFLAFVICRAFLPLLFYAPHAMAMRSMGLLEATVAKDGMHQALRDFLKWHNDKERIRVICISGRNLFCKVDGEIFAPLFDLAKEGKLDVLFPRTEEKNPTIKARYATYKPEFRKSTYPEIADLLREIEISKKVILDNQSNTVSEHDELCMWRVVLLSDHCLVQNYFPNHGGCHSDASPVFVFVKEPDCPHSYYETFSEMFKLLRGA